MNISGIWKCSNSNKELKNELRKWAAMYNISQCAIKAIIKIINSNSEYNLPIDPRTLMKTPKALKFIPIGNDGPDAGFYWHQGLSFCLQNCFKNLRSNISISINVNMNGLPIYRSANKQLWPVLFNINEYPTIKPMAIGIFYGESKPQNVKDTVR